MNKHTIPALPRAAVSIFLLFSALLLAPLSRAGQATDPNTLFDCTWSSAAVVPAPVLDAPAVSVGGNLYTFGGVVSGAISATSFKFDGTTWSAISPLPAAVSSAAAVTDGTNVYILGGAGGPTPSGQTTLNRYNVASNSYTPLASFTTGTWNHAAVLLNGKIYKFAGTGPGTASTNVLEIYNIASNTWSAGAPYPLALSFVSAWTQGGFIYGAGGYDNVSGVASLKTFRYDPVANSWNDAAIADLPATRWGAAVAFYTDAVLAGGYVDGSLNANISNTAISYDVPSNSWRAVPNMLAARARMTGAVLNNSFYVVGGRCATGLTCDQFQGTNDNQKLLCLNTPTNIPVSGGSAIVSAGPNGVLDPGEVVTVSFYAKNIGGPGDVCTTAALTGTLQATGGVTSPSAPQNYGVLCTMTPPATAHREFTFTVDPMLPCGSPVTASLQLQDGATNYGTLTFNFVAGNVATSSSENFDGAPFLPAGWTTTFSGTGTAVATSTTFPDSAPNDIFLSESAINVGLSEVASPTVAVPAGGASRLSFRTLFNTEAGFDGLVLEISIAGGAFQDILAAGGTFVSGGYNSTLSTGFANPLPGRMAWTGLSGGSAAAPSYISTVVNLPAAASGQNIRLQWRQGSDSGGAPATNPGSRVDTIAISRPVCGSSAPTLNSAVSRKMHPGIFPNPDFDVPLPLVAVAGAVGIESRTGPVAGTHTIVATFASPVTIGGTAVTTGVGSAMASVVGAVVTINLTGVTDGQRLGVTLSNVSNGMAIGNVQVPMGVLSGDTNGSGSVSATDVSQTKAAASVGTVNGSTFRSDVNASGGINATDVSIVKSRSGSLLPP